MQAHGRRASSGQPQLAEAVQSPSQAPDWISESPLLARSYALAESAHRGQQRPSDGRPFLDHVTQVAKLLDEEGFDEDLVAVGLLHDAVERGAMHESELRDEIDEGISSLVMALSEDPGIESFAERKAGLRNQVKRAGGRALTVFAADKLSDILGLREGMETFGDSVEQRIGTSVASMAGHYRESVELIETERPGSVFLPALRVQLELLETAAADEPDRHQERL